MDVADSTHEAILEDVAEIITNLDLPKIGSNVYVLWGVTERDTTMPCVIVTPNGLEAEVGGTNASDYISYPVAVLIVDRMAGDFAPPIDIVAIARQKIRQALIHQRLPHCSTVYDCVLNPAPTIDVKLAAEYQLFSSPMAFGFLSKEPRVRVA